MHIAIALNYLNSKISIYRDQYGQSINKPIYGSLEIELEVASRVYRIAFRDLSKTIRAKTPWMPQLL